MVGRPEQPPRKLPARAGVARGGAIGVSSGYVPSRLQFFFLLQVVLLFVDLYPRFIPHLANSPVADMLPGSYNHDILEVLTVSFFLEYLSCRDFLTRQDLVLG